MVRTYREMLGGALRPLYATSGGRIGETLPPLQGPKACRHCLHVNLADATPEMPRLPVICCQCGWRKRWLPTPPVPPVVHGPYAPGGSAQADPFSVAIGRP